MSIVKYLVIGLSLAVTSSPLFAQEEDPVQKKQPRFSQLISPEESEAAWKLEALGFSHRLNLSDEASTQVVLAYTNSRMRLKEAIQNAFRGRSDGSPGRKGTGIAGNPALMLTQLMNRERVTLLKSLRPLLAGTQLEHAMLTFGSFSHDWDRMVHTIAGFAFSPEKTLVALSPIEVFIARISDTQHRSGSRAEKQVQLQTHRNELLISMSNLLEDEQIKIFRPVADAVMIQTWQNAASSTSVKDKKRKSKSDPKKSTLPIEMRRYDADGDEKLTREELPEFLHPMLDRLDANKDGMLDAEELKVFGERIG